MPVELTESDELVPLGEVPQWLEKLKPWNLDNFVFLECILPDFEPCWSGEEPTQAFGPWEQQAQDGIVALEAHPLHQPGRKLLLLRNLGESYRERVEILQKARDNALVHEALESEIKKKEFLLHTVVHDLAGPLTSIKGALHILNRPGLPEKSVQELLAIGLRQADRQEKLIREILEVFAAEVDALNERKVDTSCDPKVVCDTVAENLKPAFELKGVGLECGGPSSQVVGDAAKLERVVSNLLENGLRNVPKGRSIEVLITRQEDDFVQVEISDDGPGVPEEAVGNLFRKMAKGKKGGGKIGLGLYFCRITIEAWGGEIGYRPSPSGGACFWFRLPLKK